MQKKFTVTTVTVNTIELVGEGNLLTFAALSTAATDYTLNAEVQLTRGGNWFTAQAAMVDDTIYSTVSGVRAIRFDMTSLGTATSVDVEITGANM